jgi:hypothetical protein
MPGALSGSRTEDEFDTAGELGIPRLMFLLPKTPEVTLPAEVMSEPIPLLADRQEAFRTRVEQAGLVRQLIRTPTDLETGLCQALIELAERMVPAGADGTGNDAVEHGAPPSTPTDGGSA